MLTKLTHMKHKNNANITKSPGTVSGKMPPGKLPPGNKHPRKIGPRKNAPRKIDSLDFCCF